MNGDGINNDLMYIPKDDSEINFKTEEDRVAFWKFVEQDSYLKNHKGQYAEAYAARAPWVHRFDFRLLEDFEFKIGKTKHCFQLSFDIMNVGNLINSKWGISKTNTVSNSNRILKYEGVKSATDLTPVFSMYKVNGEYPTKTYDTYQTTANAGSCKSVSVTCSTNRVQITSVEWQNMIRQGLFRDFRDSPYYFWLSLLYCISTSIITGLWSLHKSRSGE